MKTKSLWLLSHWPFPCRVKARSPYLVPDGKMLSRDACCKLIFMTHGIYIKMKVPVTFPTSQFHQHPSTLSYEAAVILQWHRNPSQRIHEDCDGGLRLGTKLHETAWSAWNSTLPMSAYLPLRLAGICQRWPDGHLWWPGGNEGLGERSLAKSVQMCCPSIASQHQLATKELRSKISNLEALLGMQTDH